MILDKFHVAFCVDDAFVVHSSASIRSMLSNASDPTMIHIWILDAGISNNNREMVKSISNEFDTKIDFIAINVKDDQSLVVDKHISRATYGRLFLPHILDKYIDKCLYLDGDTIIMDDILKLNDVSFFSFPIAAVNDFYLSHNKDLSPNESSRYFNAGIILLNLPLWRLDNLTEKILCYARNYPEKLVYWDQDAMNAVLYNKWYQLPLRWNHQIHFNDYLNHLPDGGKASEMKVAMANPAIVHFVGPEKPWHYLCCHPYKDLYFRYREKAPWSGMKLPEPEQLLNFFWGKRIAIFGAGRMGQVTLKQYRKYGCSPEYVLDNDKHKVGKMLDDLQIRSPESLVDEDLDSIVIVIASIFRDAIKAQLENMGLEEYRHFTYRGFEPHLKGYL